MRCGVPQTTLSSSGVLLWPWHCWCPPSCWRYRCAQHACTLQAACNSSAHTSHSQHNPCMTAVMATMHTAHLSRVSHGQTHAALKLFLCFCNTVQYHRSGCCISDQVLTDGLTPTPKLTPAGVLCVCVCPGAVLLQACCGCSEHRPQRPDHGSLPGHAAPHTCSPAAGLRHQQVRQAAPRHHTQCCLALRTLSACTWWHNPCLLYAFYPQLIGESPPGG